MPNKGKNKDNKDTSQPMESASEMHQESVGHKGGHMAIGAQYVKDLSFESPKAPRSLIKTEKKPMIDLSVDANAHKLQGDTYEVDLHIVAKAVVDKSAIIFLCDLTYSGMVTFFGVDEKEREAALLVQGANSLYPFARRIIADLTRDGGFPTLMLDPIDFARIYVTKKKQDSSKKKVS